MLERLETLSRITIKWTLRTQSTSESITVKKRRGKDSKACFNNGKEEHFASVYTKSKKFFLNLDFYYVYVFSHI